MKIQFDDEYLIQQLSLFAKYENRIWYIFYQHYNHFKLKIYHDNF